MSNGKTVIRPSSKILYNTISWWCQSTLYIVLLIINLAKYGISWTAVIVSALVIAALVLGVIWAKITTRVLKGVILLTDDGILMSECAAKVDGKRMSAPLTLDVAWSEVEKVGNRSIVMRNGEVYSDINWNLSKRFYDRTNMSSFDKYDWEKIKNRYYRYTNKTQQ